jgi:hypothetical protein
MQINVNKDNWPEAKKDIENGVTRVSVNDDGTIVRVATESYNGYNIPVKLVRKLLKEGELPESVMSKLSKRL